MGIGKIVSLPTSINFRGGRFKLDPIKGDFFSTRNSTIRGMVIDGHFGVYAGGFRPHLNAEAVNLPEVMKTYGSLCNYLESKGDVSADLFTKFIGVFFAGGPSPSANAVFYGITMEAFRRNIGVVGFENGVQGLMNGRAVLLNPENTWGTFREGDVLIGTSRKNPKTEPEKAQIKQNLADWGISSLIGIGGDDTNTTLVRLSERGLKVVGVPKTIDNDLPGTDATFGADTVVNASAREVFSLISDARSRDHVYVGQIMGRTSGSWATRVGMASGVTRTYIGEQFSKAGIIQMAQASAKYSALRSVLNDVAEIAIVDGKKAGSVGELIELVRSVDDSKIKIDLDAMVNQIVSLIKKRALKGYKYGFVALAEGLSDKLPISTTEFDADNKPKKAVVDGLGIEIKFDEHGNPRLADIKIAKIVASRVSPKIGSLQLGLTVSAAPEIGYQYRSHENPTAFDIDFAMGLGVEALTLSDMNQFGRLVTLNGGNISSIEFSQLPRDANEHIIPRLVDLSQFPFVQAMTIEKAKE